MVGLHVPKIILGVSMEHRVGDRGPMKRLVELSLQRKVAWPSRDGESFVVLIEGGGVCMFLDMHSSPEGQPNQKFQPYSVSQPIISKAWGRPRILKKEAKTHLSNSRLYISCKERFNTLLQAFRVF